METNEEKSHNFFTKAYSSEFFQSRGHPFISHFSIASSRSFCCSSYTYTQKMEHSDDFKIQTAERIAALNRSYRRLTHGMQLRWIATIVSDRKSSLEEEVPVLRQQTLMRPAVLLLLRCASRFSLSSLRLLRLIFRDLKKSRSIPGLIIGDEKTQL